MKEVKYIPGDLVMTDGLPIGTKKGVAYVVTASDTNRTLTLKDGTINKGVVTLDAVSEDDKAHFVETSTWVKHIVPIPLTPGILEKNGWFEDSFLDSYKSFYKNDRRYPSLHGQNTQNGYAFDIDIGETDIMTNVKYVHQLQHLLFGLGLPMDLKV